MKPESVSTSTLLALCNAQTMTTGLHAQVGWPPLRQAGLDWFSAPPSLPHGGQPPRQLGLSTVSPPDLRQHTHRCHRSSRQLPFLARSGRLKARAATHGAASCPPRSPAQLRYVGPPDAAAVSHDQAAKKDASGRWQMANRASTTVRYQTRTTIDRPISDVFERLADLDGYRTWMRRTGLFRRTGQTSDGPVGQGTAYFDATRMGTFRGEVTDYQPPARIGFREALRWFGSDLMEARPAYTLEADQGKTIVHHVAEGELFGMMRLMKPVAALLARSERARTVESLKRSLESD